MTGGFAAIPTSIARDPNIHPSAKAVFCALASYADDSGTAWPAVRTLAGDLGMSEDTVNRHLETLRAYGVLAWEVRSTSRGRQRFYSVWRPGDAVGSPHPGGGVPAPQGQGVPAPQGVEQEPENQNQGTTPAAVAAAGEDGALLTVEQAGGRRVQPMPSGRDLFAAWVDAYRSSHRRDPDPASRGPLLGQVKQVVKTRTDLESWRAALRAFYAAGAEGSVYVTRHLLNPAPPRPAIPSPGERYDPAFAATLPPPPRTDLYG